MLRPAAALSLLLLPVAIFYPPAPARAAVTEYVTIQPIDVCSNTGTGCAPINNKNQTAVTNPGTTQIGFIDASTGINVTNAVLNQAGVGVAFLPVAQDNNTTAQAISVASCAANGTDCSSPQFQAVSDQAGISMGSPPNPAPPLSKNPATINMFFVNSLIPPANQPGQLYGLSWVGNNGIAIGKNTFSPPFPLTPRFDTLAHEIGHDLDLDHSGLGAGPANNLMTAGNVRIEPTSTSNLLAQITAMTADQLTAAQQTHVLGSGLVAPIPNISNTISDPGAILVGRCVEFAACYSGATPTAWSDTLSLADLQSLGLGTTQPFVAGQTSQFVIRLGPTTISFTTGGSPIIETLPEFNGSGSHGDPCNFCQIDTVGNFMIPADATGATISGSFGNSTVPNSAGVDLCLGAGAPCAPPNDFSTSFAANTGRPNEALDTLILTAPTGVDFDPATFAQLFLPDDTNGITLVPTFSGCTVFGEDGERCGTLSIAFQGDPFVGGDKADYTVGFCLIESLTCTPDANVADLAGGTYTYQFSDGYQTTSLLAGDQTLTANSQDPDPAISPEIYDAALLLAASMGQAPCTPVNGQCPPLTLEDGSPLTEGGQLVPAPEPPALPMLIAALGLVLVLRQRPVRGGSPPAL